MYIFVLSAVMINVKLGMAKQKSNKMEVSMEQMYRWSCSAKKIGINYECNIYNNNKKTKNIWIIKMYLQLRGYMGPIPPLQYCTIEKAVYSPTSLACHSIYPHRGLLTVSIHR